MKNRILKLPNGEHKEYNDFEKYLIDVEKIVSQKKWTLSKKHKDDKLKLMNQSLDIEVKILVKKQRNKFYAENLEDWEKKESNFKEHITQIVSQQKKIQPYVSQLFRSYESSDSKENHRGWINFSFVVIECYGKDSLDQFKREWMNKMFHGDMEIELAFQQLDSLGKLELVVNKFL